MDYFKLKSLIEIVLKIALKFQIITQLLYIIYIYISYVLNIYNNCRTRGNCI